MFIRFLRFELFRAKKLVLFLALIGLSIVITIVVSLFLSQNSNFDKKSLYSINKYGSIEELQINLEHYKTVLDFEKTEYEKAANANANLTILYNKKNNISTLERTISAMEVLKEKDIPYECAVEYHSFDNKNGASAITSFIGIMSLILQLYLVIKVSTIIPSEIEKGQAKLTLILPLGRVKYAIYKWAVEIIKSLIFLLFFALFAFATIAVFFPIKSTYLIYATTTRAFALPAFSSLLLQLCFSIFKILVSSLTALGISLIFRKNFLSVVISLILCFSNDILEALQQGLNLPSKLINWLLPLNINIDKIFYKLNANNIIIAILISVISASVILTMALLRFRKKDIC